MLFVKLQAVYHSTLKIFSFLSPLLKNTSTHIQGDGITCEEFDECLNDDDNDCDANADCTNTVGSFECACKNGFSGDGVQCDDIDECDTETDNCHDLATCTNKKVGKIFDVNK